MFTTIYLAAFPGAFGSDSGVTGYALAEDGRCVASHVSSDAAWARHDLGLTSDWKHDAYDAACPEGWRLEWVDRPDEHEGWKAAAALNKAAANGD